MSMIILRLLVGILWLIWLVYWIISALSAKKTIRGRNWLFEAVFRIAVVGVIILILRVPALYDVFFVNYFRSLSSNPLANIIGFILVVIGLALAIWARVYLGKNWGMPTTLREKPELVTTGPYACVRHPIYTGIITAIFGTALVTSLLVLIPFFAASVYFIFSLRVEEKDMLKQFPQEYASYKKRTKALIPFIY